MYRALFFIASLVLALSFPARADSLTGRVVRVADGDTITVLDANNQQHKLRLSGIDAPEIKQAYGQASRKHLAALIAGKTVLAEWYKRYKYGRTVTKVLLNGQDVCLDQIKAGMAWHYKKYETEQTLKDRHSYAEAEQVAREAKRGLWQDKEPVPPWEWRHSQMTGH